MIIDPNQKGKQQIKNSNNQQEEVDGSITHAHLIKYTKKAVDGKNQRSRFKKAKKYLYNALQFKAPRVDIEQNNLTPTARWAYKNQTNQKWRSFLLLLSYVFMYMSFGGHRNANPILVAFQILIILVFMFDITLQIIHKTFNKLNPKNNFKPKFYVKTISVVLLLVDSIIALVRPDLPVRPFLILRCVIPVAIDAQVRKIFNALRKTYKVIIVYMIFYFLVIIVFGMAANQFIHIPPDKQSAYYYENYNDLGNSIFLMYVLTTFDEYPNNQREIVKLNIWIYAFYIVYILLIALLFAAIPINILMDSIKETRSKSIIVDEIEQQHNLIMSFIALGGDKTRSIPYKKFIRFLLYLFNFQAKYLDKIAIICKNLDERVNGSIECIQFMQICKVIQSREYLSPPKHRYWKKLTHFEALLEKKFKLRTIVKSEKMALFDAAFSLFIFINCILNIYVNSRVFDVIDDVIMVLLMILVSFKIIATGPETFFNNFMDVFDILLLGIAFIFQVLPASANPRNIAVFAKMLRIFRINRIVSLLSKKLRYKQSNEIYKRLTNLVNQIALLFPILLKFFPLYLISFYALGVLGSQIFWYKIDKQTEYNDNRQFSNFDTLLGSQFLFIQILVEACWSVLVFDHADRYGHYGLIVIFFIFCHQIIVILLSSLFKGIVWQCYNTISSAQDDHEDKKKEKVIVLQGLVNRYRQFKSVKKIISSSKQILPTDCFIRELYQRKIDKYILEVLRFKINYNYVEYGTLFPLSEIILPSPEQNLKKCKLRSYPLNQEQITRRNEPKLIDSIYQPFQTNKQFQNIPPNNNSLQNINNINGDSQKINVQESQFQKSAQIQQNVQKLFEDDYEKEVDQLLENASLHKSYQLSLSIQNPKCFVNYLQNHLKTLPKYIPKGQFDPSRDTFTNEESVSHLMHDIHTILGIQTPQKQQRFMIINSMVQMGIIDEERASKMILQNSQYQNQLTFDYNWVIRKTYLSDLSQNDIKGFEMKYFSSVYGESFNQINKINLDRLMEMEAKITYSLSAALRYPEIQTSIFFKTLVSIQNKINVQLLRMGSLCKFVYQIKTDEDNWFTIDLKDSNQVKIQFIKSGLWISSNKNLKKDDIYFSKNLFNWDGYQQQPNKEEFQKYIKKFYQAFESLAFACDDKDSFFNPQPHKLIYNLFTFYRDVEKTPRDKHTFPQISKIMFFILSNQSSKENNVPFSLSDLVYSQEYKEQYKQKMKVKFTLDENSNQMSEMLEDLQNHNSFRNCRQTLPFAYIINLLVQIRDLMILNEKNFVLHVQKVLASYLGKNRHSTKIKTNRFARLKQKRMNSVQ